MDTLTMDAVEEEQDIKLQRYAADLLADFDRSLPGYLRKPDGAGGERLRSRVRTRETWRLVANLLEPFQELPQLLDPHLPKYLPALGAAYLEHLQSRRGRDDNRPLSTRSKLLEPLGTAVCRILYTFCKVRGEKVVVRFLSVETKYLELLLEAVEEAERGEDTVVAAAGDGLGTAGSVVSYVRWNWHERYIVLLWLSHLLLAPFDLASISSVDAEDLTVPDVPSFVWPAGLPGIAVRVLPLAIKYLASPGKERDASKALLVRMAMRKDMQQLGVLDALVKWSITSLRPPRDTPAKSPYFYIGILAFLAGVLRASTDTSDMDGYLGAIFEATHAISLRDTPVADAIVSSALARKMIIKVMRSVAVLVLRHGEEGSANTEVIETTISYLLESLADNDTPVRFSASKALSIVTLKLDPEMAAQVVDAVLEALNRNVLWVTGSSGKQTRNLATVDPLEWHGLMLTLAHLLYRRSPPAAQLADIAHALLLGLAFERRSTSGNSMGTNVRDAACFGIWAMARRYTTTELLAVPTNTVSFGFPLSSVGTSRSILQILATSLVVAASLDNAGNIRRGSSAALQELIGRHPDTVSEGIWVVQTVDYHAVALRSRAIHEVALKATKLDSQYGEALLEALLGWRGIGDTDAAARRVAGAAYGTLLWELAQKTSSPSVRDSRDDGDAALARFVASAKEISQRLQALQTRQVEERHGLLLCYAGILDKFPALHARLAPTAEPEAPSSDGQVASILLKILSNTTSILSDCTSATFRRPELVAEAASRLVVSLVPVLQAAIFLSGAGDGSNNNNNKGLGREVTPRPGQEVVSPDSTDHLALLVRAVDTIRVQALHTPEEDAVTELIAAVRKALAAWLTRNEKEVITVVSEAALVYLLFCAPTERDAVVAAWSETVTQKPGSSRAGPGHGYFYALTMGHPVLYAADDGAATGLGPQAGVDPICGAVITRWTADTDIETRVAILQSLTQSDILRRRPLVFLDILSEALNDYTTNARGDVGSHVRLEALKATQKLWSALPTVASDTTPSTVDDWLQTTAERLFLQVLRLAAEKLDRVRSVAQLTLGMALNSSHASRFNKFTFSSRTYFHSLLQLYSRDSLHPLISSIVKGDDASAWTRELLAGYVSSADTGNEELVIASRAALCDFCDASAANLDRICAALSQNLKFRQGNDRVLVPTLEIVAFLFHVGLFQRSVGHGVVDLKGLCLQVQKAAYKTGNVRKLEACIRVYGVVARLGDEEENTAEMVEDGMTVAKNTAVVTPAAGVTEKAQAEGEAWSKKRRAGIAEARKRLGALLFHPWPRVRSLVVDELWLLLADDGVLATKLKGVDWGKAEKATIRAIVEDFGLV